MPEFDEAAALRRMVGGNGHPCLSILSFTHANWGDYQTLVAEEGQLATFLVVGITNSDSYDHVLQFVLWTNDLRDTIRYHKVQAYAGFIGVWPEELVSAVADAPDTVIAAPWPGRFACRLCEPPTLGREVRVAAWGLLTPLGE